MSSSINVRIDWLEFLNAQGVTELQVSAVDEPLAAIVRMPVIDQPQYTSHVARLRAEGRAFAVAGDFFEMPEEAKCRELERAVRAHFHEIPDPEGPPGETPALPPEQEPGRRLARVIHRTNGRFMVLQNSDGEFGIIDDIEINKLREFFDDDPVADRRAIASLVSAEIWDQDLTMPLPMVTLALRENRWALELDDGRLFADLDDRDIVAIRHARGW
jgi:hypothetical protein